MIYYYSLGINKRKENIWTKINVGAENVNVQAEKKLAETKFRLTEE